MRYALAIVLAVATASCGDYAAAPARLPRMTSSAMPSLSTIAVRLSEPEATASVIRELNGKQVDRVQSKLMTWSEFVNGTGLTPNIANWSGAAPIWVVAVAGDIPSRKKTLDDTPATSAVCVVDAMNAKTFALLAVWTDAISTWPTTFDALPNHPSTPAPALTPPPGPRLGLRLGPVEVGMSASQVMSVLGEPTEKTVSHGLGAPEWHYAIGLTVFLRGAPTDPGSVFAIWATAPFSGATVEGARIGSTREEVVGSYAGFAVITQPSAQLQVSDQAKTILNIEFDASGRADRFILTTPP